MQASLVLVPLLLPGFFFLFLFVFYRPAARYRYGGYVGWGGVIGSGASDILSTYLRNGWLVGWSVRYE